MSNPVPNATAPLFSAVNGTIRSTTPVASAPIPLDLYVDYLLLANNTLDQAGNLQMQHSLDGGVSYINVGTAIALGAASGVSLPVIPSKLFAGLVRVQYTATVIPTTGVLLVWLQLKGNA